jgi:hypothetical protein
MRIKQTRIVIAILAFIAALVAAPVASASSISFTGSGMWDQGTPTTAYSGAGATWQFSFLLPDTLSSNPTTQVTDFSYSLNGSTVTTSLPGGVLFYSVADGGGFDLYPTINNASNVSVLSFLFPSDVGSNLKIVGGTFQTSIELNDGITTADGLTPGSGFGTVTIASAATPEPPSVILLGTALLLGSGLIRLRRTPARANFHESRPFVAEVISRGCPPLARR